MNVARIKELADRVRTSVHRAVVGKDEVIDMLFIGIVAKGHILMEDVPGTGKTLLAKSVARALACDFKRIQFTPDLLPGDLTGIHFYDQRSGDFKFRAGPVFTNILLADEINRATPRTQSSLLEAMEERQVTVDGETRLLARPFFVVATQNPVESQGTFPLPEAQLDRFLMKIGVSYPTREEGLAILRNSGVENPPEHVEPVAGAREIEEAQAFCASLAVADEILEYLLAIVEKTRRHEEVALGVSPRGSQALLRAAQAHAALRGRDYVVPDDVLRLAAPVLEHRMVLRSTLSSRRGRKAELLQEILRSVPVPAEAALLPE